MSEIENGQHWLSRNRPPRVQITYDVEIGDAVEKKELPLVVGILAHLGRGDSEATPLSQKRFEPIDRDNFDELLAGIAPAIRIKGLEQEVTFRRMVDFHPEGLLKHANIPELSSLFEERQKLRDMLAKLDGNEVMGQQLQKFIDKQDPQVVAADGPISAAELKDTVALLRAGTANLKVKVKQQQRAHDELVLATAASVAAVAAAEAAKAAAGAARESAAAAAEALPAASAADAKPTVEEATAADDARRLAADAADQLAVARSDQAAKERDVLVAKAAVETAAKRVTQADAAVSVMVKSNSELEEKVKQASRA